MTAPTPRTIERARTVAKLHRAGYTLDVIAHHLDVTPRTAHRLHATSKTLPPEPPMPSTREWGPRGRCRREDPELFFPISYDNDTRQVRAAKTVCRACPVLDDCRTYALDHPGHTADGIWGAMTPTERRDARRAQTGRTAAA